MIVIFAKAAVRLHHPTLPPGEIHAVVAVARTDDIAIATQSLEERLLARGFAGVAIDQYASVSAWRALMPTTQGVMLRRGLRYGLDLTIFVQPGQVLSYGIPIVADISHDS